MHLPGYLARKVPRIVCKAILHDHLDCGAFIGCCCDLCGCCCDLCYWFCPPDIKAFTVSYLHLMTVDCITTFTSDRFLHLNFAPSHLVLLELQALNTHIVSTAAAEEVGAGCAVTNQWQCPLLSQLSSQSPVSRAPRNPTVSRLLWGSSSLEDLIHLSKQAAFQRSAMCHPLARERQRLIQKR